MTTGKILLRKIIKFCLFAFICVGLVFSIMKAEIFYIILFSLSFLSFLYLMIPGINKKE